MGIYLNPNNDRFYEAVNSPIYIDKTGLISVVNQKIKTTEKFICVSRPRRFGKSMNLGMLAAYYSVGCDSDELFQGLYISKEESYRKHLNKYNVIYINMQQFLSNSHNINEMLSFLKQSLMYDLEDDFSDIKLREEMGLTYNLNRVYQKKRVPFVVLIDEWDCVMREHRNNKDAQKIYLDFLRDFLKDQDYVAFAYMTGILPVKKYGTHSALNMFDEYSMLGSEKMQKYIGFTDAEVRMLCETYNADYFEMKAWYDGYQLDGEELYCPRSVVKAVDTKKFMGYWTETETYEALSVYISMNFDGLKDAIEKLLAGQEQPVDTRTFSNDMITFANKDDILTLLIHLGYLGYNSDKKTAYIPNKEIYDEFLVSMKVTGLWKETIEAVSKSKQLLSNTLNGNAEVVAESIEAVHDSNSSVINYNNEQSLRFIILIAYYYAKEQYDIVQEMPAGKGFADIMLIPKPRTGIESYPPMVIELKWDKSAETAITQIKDKNYPERLKSFGKVLLVGISYDKDTKKHNCIIEKHNL
ncbi:MAG: AAA family ATPase [Clostridia bacterium]|nr:AAA family ATPase [Clostridia bacterium]